LSGPPVHPRGGVEPRPRGGGPRPWRSRQSMIPRAAPVALRKLFPAIEFLVQLLQHLPDPRAHLVRRYGLYSL